MLKPGDVVRFIVQARLYGKPLPRNPMEVCAVDYQNFAVVRDLSTGEPVPSISKYWPSQYLVRDDFLTAVHRRRHGLPA